MRAANIIAGVVAALWFAVFLMGRDVMHGVHLQDHSIAPNAGQIDYYIVYPLVAVVMTLFAGWTGNIRRNRLIALIPSLLIGFALFPFLLGYTGGM